jgi:hypothetical protein
MKVTAYRNNRCFGSYIYEVPRLHLPHFKTDLHNIPPGKPCVATRHNVTSPSHLVEVEVPCFGLYKSTEHNPAIGRARSIRLPICVQTSYLPLLEFYICIIDFTGGGKVGLVNRLLDLEGHKT